MDRLISLTHSENNKSDKYTYHYNAGQLVRSEFPAGSEDLKYHPTGKVDSQKRELTLNGKKTIGIIENSLDWLGQPQATSYAYGEDQETTVIKNIQYNYDQYEYLYSVPGVVEGVQYHPNMKPEKIIYSSGLTQEIKYQQETDLVSEISATDEFSQIYNDVYAYDLKENLKQKNSLKYEYYDNSPKYWLKSEGDELLDYGSRPERNAFGELLVNNGAALSYNPAGQISKAVKDNNNANYYYDAQGTLVGISKENQSNERRVFVNSNFEIRDNKKVFINLEFFHRPIAMIEADIPSKTAQTHSYVTDRIGSIVAIQKSKNEKNTYAYSAYGKGTVDNKLKRGFLGSVHDDFLNIYFFGVRAYTPENKEFLTADPAAMKDLNAFLTDPDQLDLFRYAKNNPLKYVDHSGEFAIAPVFAVAAVAGLTAGVCTFGFNMLDGKSFYEGIREGMFVGAMTGASIATGSAFVQLATKAYAVAGIASSGVLANVTGKVAQTVVAAGIDAGYRYLAQGKSFDLLKSTVRGAGYTLSGGILKWGPALSPGLKESISGMSTAHTMLYESTKSYLNSQYSYTYSKFSNTVSGK